MVARPTTDSLQRADEALRDAVAFGLPHEARGTFDAEERDLLLKIVGQVVRPVVVTSRSPRATPSPMPPKRSRMPWRIGSRALEGSRAWRHEDRLGRAVVATSGKAGPSATVTVAVMVPHITSGASTRRPMRVTSALRGLEVVLPHQPPHPLLRGAPPLTRNFAHAFR